MNSSPTSPTTYQSEPIEPASIKQPPGWLMPAIFGLSILAFILLVGRQEISRWHYASAKNAIEDHRYDDAIEAANNGLRWNPEYVELIAMRAAARMEKQDFEACLSDYDRMMELAAADEIVNERDIAPKAAKAGVLQRMDRFADAIAILNEIVDYRRDEYQQRDDVESTRAYAMSLNNRAYIEAQAHTVGVDNIDVARALSDIETALTMRDANDPVMLDTLGYLQLLNGRNEEALATMIRAVELTALENRRYRDDLMKAMQQVVDQRPIQAALKQLDEQYSIILHHRGEAYLAMDEEDKGQKDIEEAKRLGYNQEEGIW